MELKKLQFNWNKLGEIDPLWAILSFPDKEGNKWNIRDFFATGEQEINDVIATVKSFGIKTPLQRSLDFGCGIGRLTQALATHSEEVHGVDIALSMISKAQEFNSDTSRVFYHLNTVDNLRLFPDNYFDLIYSNIVLQHIEPSYSKKYIQEFLRVLLPGGILIFQLPENISTSIEKNRDNTPISWRHNFKNRLRHIISSILPLQIIDFYRFIVYGNIASKRANMEMYGVKKEEVISLIKEWSENIEILDIKNNDSVDEKWISWCYFITKVK